MAVSRTTLTWVGLFATLLPASLVLGSSALAVAAVVLLSFPMIGATILPPRNVRVERKIARATNWVGDNVTIERRVTVSKGIGPIFIHGELPEEMLLIGGNNFRVLWKWPGEKTFDASYTLLSPKRGVFRIGKTSWRAEAPLRLRGDTRGEGTEQLEITFVPRLGIHRIAEIRARATNIAPNSDRATIGVESTDFIVLRNYSHGDPVRSINWKASARHGASARGLIVNKYQMEGRRAVWIFIDGASYMSVGTSVSNPFEYAIEAAFSIAHYYLTQGFTLGAYVFNNRRGYLSPDAGNKQLLRLKKILLEIDTSDEVEGLPAAIARCKYPIFQLRPEILIITRIDAFFANPMNRQGHFDTLVDGVLGQERVAPSDTVAERRRPPIWDGSEGSRIGHAEPCEVGDAAASEATPAGGRDGDPLGPLGAGPGATIPEKSVRREGSSLRSVSSRTTEAGLWVAFATMAVYSFTRTMVASGRPVDVNQLLKGIVPENFFYDIPEPLLLVAAVAVVPILFARTDTYTSFWIGTLLGATLFTPAIVASSEIYWPLLFGVERAFQPGISEFTLLALTVLSIEALYAISRLIALRARQQTLEVAGVLVDERTQIADADLQMIGIAVAASTVLATIVVGIGLLLSNADVLFAQLPWTVITTGLLAIVAMSIFLIVWVRTLAGEEKSDVERP